MAESRFSRTELLLDRTASGNFQRNVWQCSGSEA